MTEEQSRALAVELSRRLVSRQDRLLRKFDGHAKRLLLDLAAASREGSLAVARDALDSFQRGAGAAARLSVKREARGALHDLKAIYDVRSGHIPSGQLDQRINDFMARMRGGLFLGYVLPHIIGQSIDLHAVAMVQATLLPRAEIARVRRSFDYLAGGSIQNTIYEIGILHFKQKVSVPHLDRENTDLCRNRMAFQVRPWEELFVDGKTGAGWLHGPFVGAGLPRAESFHFCRTNIAPWV